MDKIFFCIKGTVKDIFLGRVNILHQIPNCWAFYGFKHEVIQTLDKTINSLKSEEFTKDQKEKTVKTLENLLAKTESKFSRIINIKNNEKSKSNC